MEYGAAFTYVYSIQNRKFYSRYMYFKDWNEMRILFVPESEKVGEAVRISNKHDQKLMNSNKVKYSQKYRYTTFQG